MPVTIIVNNKKKFFIYCGSIIFAFLIGLFFGSLIETEKYDTFISNTIPVRNNASALTYVAPLLGISSPDATTVNIFNPLRDQLESMRQIAEDTNKIDDAAIYFRDLNSSFWFGVDEETNYITASLFKLPIAMAAYKQNEIDPTFFKKIVYYTPAIAAQNKPENGAASTTLVVGQGYMIRDLIIKMLTASDNGAKNLLTAEVGKERLEEVFSFSALLEPDFARQYILSPKNFSIFFRILYSATYLSPADSNDLLKILTTTTFKEGVVNGVDSSVPVAHKFGLYVIDRGDANNPGKEELHDCGIIYHPRHPYVLCVMTKGSSDANLRAFISDISKAVYSKVENDYDK